MGSAAPERVVGLGGREGRRWLWRLIAAVGVTSMVLLLIEGGLRLVGYGFPTAFFLVDQDEGGDQLLNNPQYGWRFFPPALARECWPFTLPATKAPGTRRIFVFGESAAMGDPDPRFGLPRMIEALLKQRFVEHEFEVVNVAFTAINSHVILPIARECARQQGDLWILYLGNNEVAGPFGPATVFGAQSPPMPVIRANIALRSTRFGQWLDAMAGTVRGKPSTPEEWQGMEMVVGNEIGPSDPRLASVYGAFRSNIEDMLRVARRSGVPVLLCTMGTNLRDCAPFASRHRGNLSAAQLAQWEKLYQAGVALQNAGDLAGALTHFRQALAGDDEYADLHFRLGECLLGLHHAEAAADHFRRARDADALRFRADSRLNQIFRDVARAAIGMELRLFDAEEFLARHSPYGLPGADLFFEHVHLTPAGNYLLARGMVEEVSEMLALSGSAGPERSTLDEAGVEEPGLVLGGGSAWASEEECRRWLGLTDRNLLSLLGKVLTRMNAAPFNQQLSQPTEVRRLRELQAALRQGDQMPSIQRLLEDLSDLVKDRPKDGDLRSNYAAMLASAGDLEGAEREWRGVVDCLPNAVQGWIGLGLVIEAQGRRAEAAECYRHGLELSPRHPQARARLDALAR